MVSIPACIANCFVRTNLDDSYASIRFLCFMTISTIICQLIEEAPVFQMNTILPQMSKLAHLVKRTV